MYEEGKTYREIIKEVHMSPGDISSIIRKHTGVSGRADQQEEQTTDTKVFRLFEEGKSPVQVAIDLDLPSTEVARLKREYWKLKGLQVLDDLYEDIKDEVFQFQRTYELFKDEGYTPRQLIEVANHRDELPSLRRKNEQLIEENQNLEQQKWNKVVELERANQSVTIAKQNLNSINADIQKKTEELGQLNNKKFETQKIIVSLDTSPGYQQIQRIAESSARNVLNQNQLVLTSACRAIFEALKEEPRNELEFLIQGSLSYPFYEPGTGRIPQNLFQHRQAVLVHAAEDVYRNLLSKVVNTTMSSAFNEQSGSGYGVELG